MWIYVNVLLITLAWIGICLYLLINSFKIDFLKTQPATAGTNTPDVCIIVATRNEEKHLHAALESLLLLSYNNYHLIAVNDRSTDATGAIINNVCKHRHNTNCIHIEHLPQGWLGKSNALHLAAKRTSAEWILFTDADVMFNSSALTKAINYCNRYDIDHLTLLPETVSGSALLNSVYSTFRICFFLKYQPWQAVNQQSALSLGMGAFNLVKRSAYEHIGGHSSFAMHPNDDLKLAEKIKQAGYRQQVLFGKGEIWYEWYPDLLCFVNGLTKNAFSSVNYHAGKAVLNAAGCIIFFVLPVPFMLLSGEVYLQLMAPVILGFQTTLLLLQRSSTAKWWHVFMIPFAACIISFIMLRSVCLTLYQQGIYWSQHFYTLSELKRYR